MLAPHQAHYMAADALHAERLANAARGRLAASSLKPHATTPRVAVQRTRVVAAMTSMLLAVVLATGVAAAVGTTSDTAPAAPNAAAGAGQGGGGAILVR